MTFLVQQGHIFGAHFFQNMAQSHIERDRFNEVKGPSLSHHVDHAFREFYEDVLPSLLIVK